LLVVIEEVETAAEGLRAEGCSAHAEAGNAKAPGQQSLLERDAGISECVVYMVVIA